MSFGPFPTVAECCIFIENLRIASLICGIYCMACNFIYYSIICEIYRCKEAFSALVVFFRTLSTITLMVSSAVLLLGLFFKNVKFVQYFVRFAMVCFCLDTISAFYHMYLVIINLEKCFTNAYVNACVGLMMPLTVFYCIVVVRSYRLEMNYSFYDAMEKEEELITPNKKRKSKV